MSAPEIPVTTEGLRAPGPTASETNPSFVELSDEELIGWLTASILDEDSEHERVVNAETQDFWDRVACTEAALASLGLEGPLALDRAIGMVGLDASLGGDNGDTPTTQGGVLVWATSTSRGGEYELLRVHTEIVEAASRAVAHWASSQGSALRAANQSKG